MKHLMVRDLERLANEAFDVLVIGGGIYGLATLRELTARGLRSALIDRGDFAAATSFNSLKTVHGGIRALQHGAISTMRQFVRERRGLAVIAPHLVRPLPFVVPTHRHPVRNHPVMTAFLAAYDLLASDRNDGVDASLALPASRTVSRLEFLRLNPLIDPSGVTGGAVWHDYQLHSPERLAVGLLTTAIRSGAAAANYTEAQQFVQQHGAIRAVRVHDLEGRAHFDVQCRFVINAAGPWAWNLLRRSQAVPASVAPPAMSLALNAVIDHRPPANAVGGLARGRFLFLVPWRDRSIVGTSHDPFNGDADDLSAAQTRLESFLRDAAQAFPGARITPKDVRLVHRGLLPAKHGATLLTESLVHDHRTDGVDGLVTVLGVRYTTARATAAAAAELVATRLGKRSGTSAPSLEPIAGGKIANLQSFEQEQLAEPSLRPSTTLRLIAAYGSECGTIVKQLRDDPALATPLSPTCSVTRAEIVHAVRTEMAIHLADALVRRTEAGTGGHPGEAAVHAAAAVMAEELGWTAARVSEEIADVEATYQPPVRT
jgi:glycerol-3-phosphate dehydrogenase